MTTKRPAADTELQDDEAPDLSASPWKDRFCKALLASAPLEGIELERDRSFGRDVPLTDDGTPLQTDPTPTSDEAKR